MGRGRIEGRLRRLEEQAGRERRDGPEDREREKERWLAQARFRRREALKERDADHARSLIRLFRAQGILPGMGADELVGRVLAWRPEPDGGRSRAQVEREVALAIHEREPGTEGMACPRAWRESFARGDELAERYGAIPDEVLAEGYARLGRIAEEDGEALEEWAARYEEPYGITGELVENAVGPDVGAITEEERRRRLDGYLADSIYGEKGYGMRRHMDRIEASEASTGGEGRR